MSHTKTVTAAPEQTPCVVCGGSGESPEPHNEAPYAPPCRGCDGKGTVNAGLFRYLVEYGKQRQMFACLAENADHAREQCLDAYPDEQIYAVGLVVPDGAP